MIKCHDCGDKLRKKDLNLCVGCDYDDYCKDCSINYKGKNYCATCYEWCVLMPKDGWKSINQHQKRKLIRV